MKILDKYIGSRFLVTFFFIIILLLLISIVIDLTENLDEMIEEGTPAIPIINYYLDFVPWISSLLAPLFVFISVIFFTSRLTNNSEIIATISGGVSFYRLLMPYLVSGVIIAILFYFTNHFWLPKSNGDIIDFKQEWLGKDKTLDNSRNIHIQIDEDRILYLSSYNNTANRGYNMELETFDGNDVTHKMKARTIEWDDSLKQWSANSVEERFIYPNREELTSTRKIDSLDIPLLPADFVIIDKQWTTLSTPKLNKAMKREKEKGSNLVKFYQVEKNKRTSTPVSILIFTIMGFAIASRKARGGTGVHLALGFLLSGIFVFLMNFSETFTESTNASPVFSVWFPNIIFTVIAAILVWKAQK